MLLSANNLEIKVDFILKEITSIKALGVERLNCPAPLFKASILNKNGDRHIFDAYDTTFINKNDNVATYSYSVNKNGFSFENLTITVTLDSNLDDTEWFISVNNVSADYVLEWVMFPYLVLPALKKNGNFDNGGEILYPFNEGAIIDDLDFRQKSSFKHKEIVYPSEGNYPVFPNMVFAQFISYHFNDAGLYFGAHDVDRGLKGIDFVPDSNGVGIILQHFTGNNFGDSFTLPYPVIISKVSSNWESAGEKYRTFFENNLPNGVKKIDNNDKIPTWYKDLPLVVSYPIRGKFDYDVMTPNSFYPYTNAIDTINDIKAKTNAKILTLLMHWEGTAPWAPPYVWPPYGDLNNFNKFRRLLKDNGDLLGVYCSGFGYTLKSNLCEEYNMEETYYKDNLSNGMCASEKGEIKSVICQKQRISYDVCPASKVGREILDSAYKPLFDANLDYVQILDQNHGGGQYLCYSKKHNHPPVPGVWMTKNMQNMLSSWNDLANNTLFGCESAAAEPFIGNLLFSDNRFELNWMMGRPVSLYSYIYHEYVKNFMGNQVCNPFHSYEDTFNYRLAYSFIAGDCMTIVLSPDGSILPNWGHREGKTVDKDKTLAFIKTLTDFYNNEGKKYLYNAKRIPAKKIDCDTVCFDAWAFSEKSSNPKVLTAAYTADNNNVQFICNPFDSETVCKVDGVTYRLKPLSIIMINI